jgi:hypothetical protein
MPVALPTATCPILHLTLGPLDLNLLGLKVHLDRVVLDITARPVRRRSSGRTESLPRTSSQRRRARQPEALAELPPDAALADDAESFVDVIALRRP